MTRVQASQVVPAWTLEAACLAGSLRRVFPGVYVDPTAAGAPIAHRAALAYVDGRTALSHTTALEIWGIRPQPVGEPVHLSVPAGSGVRSRANLVIHQRRELEFVVRQDMPVTGLERSLVDSWPLLPLTERPAPLIRAVNGRHTTAQRIEAALASAPKLTGRAQLRRLLDRLAAGCRSALEIWGHDHVFVGPGMPRFQRQTPVRIGGRTVYLDAYAQRERVDIELDGATSHGDLREREIDLRRDAQLAAKGIMVVRFAHRRLVHETAEVRREILAILRARRTTT